jgi:hypothetical protein
MARLFVEGWDPSYGSPLEPDDAMAPTAASVDDSVETTDWRPLDGVDDGVTHIAFVDGVRRIDARLTLDDPATGPIPGICGTLAVGVTRWDRHEKHSHVDDVRIERHAVLSQGRDATFPAVPFQPQYEARSIADADPDRLIGEVHDRMRHIEGEVATRIASEGVFVVADGPLKALSNRPVVGHVKSHRVTYLPPERNAVIAALEPGQRTPLFTMAEYQRYSWYQRLARIAGGHSWTGVVRCEVSGQLSVAEVRVIADRCAAVLPLVASEPHIDPRAPQNLVPVAALERELRRRMGDVALINRGLRAAVNQHWAA